MLFYAKVGDTHTRTVKLTQGRRQQPMSLTAAVEVRLVMRDRDGLLVINEVLAIDDAAGGEVTVPALDFPSAGIYNGEFQVTLADGSIATAPEREYVKAIVTESIT